MSRFMAIVPRPYGFLKRLALFSFLSLASIPQAMSEEWRPFDNLWGGTKEIAEPENLSILAIGGGLTIVSLYFDQKIVDHFNGTTPPSWINSLGQANQFFKRDLGGFLMGGAAVAYGIVSDRSHELSAGQAQLEGILVYDLTVASVKFFSYRNGPTGDNYHHAFPSGQDAFPTSAVIDQYYGFWWSFPVLAIGTLGILDYTVRSVHWESDMIFGAALGYATGQAFARFHLKKDGILGKQAGLYPMIGPDESGYHYGVGLEINL